MIIKIKKSKFNILQERDFNFLSILFIFILYLIILTQIIYAQDITINVTAEDQQTEGSVITFDEQDFEESQKTTLVEFLQSQSFMYVASGIDEAEIGFLVLRGFTTSRIAIFLDGIPITLSQINALRLPLSIISKITIYKGNVSALFGPNAIGGAILIWTKNKESGAINFGTIYLSSLINIGMFAHLSFFNNNFFSSLDLQVKFNTNSYNDSFGNSDFYDIFSKFNLEYQSLAFSFFVDYSKKYLPNDIQFPYYKTYKDSLSLFSFLKFEDLLFSFQYFYEEFSCHDYTYLIDEERKLLFGFLHFPFMIFKSKNALLNSSLSLRIESINDDTLMFNNLYQSLFSFSLIFNKSFDNLLNIEASSSIDLNLKYTQDLVYQVLPSIYFHLEKGYDLKEDNLLKLFIKGATGYRLPTYQELYSTYGIIAIGNPDLKPEKSIGMEFGLILNLFKLNFDFSFYYYYFNDFIVWLRRFDNRFKPINFAQGNSLGIDLNLSYTIPLNEEFYIDISGYFSLTISKITEGLLILNEVYVPYIPLLNLIFNIDLAEVEKFKLKLELIYRGIRYITLENYNWFSPYFLLNLNFTYYISEKQNITISIENLLSATYYDLLYYPISNLVINIDFSFYF